ncbi:MAG: metalloregulator ArsR/SmtB family transcription factor [Spirochaetales bacterium]|nr:metalloregulator ArsR/SmtB family transcription factor [Spirochaetales bacterium]
MSIFPSKPDEDFKIFVYEQFSRLGKALSSPHRLILLNILCQGEHSVEALVDSTGLNVANVSRHLQMMKSVKLVKIRREGKYIFYSLADEETCLFFMEFRRFAEKHSSELHAAMNLISDKPSRIAIVNMDEMKEIIAVGSAVIIDVRPESEYKTLHLPGAISIPLDELEDRYREIPAENDVITYCRDNYCILADKAVNFLLNKGRNAKRLDIGILNWKQAGLPVETGFEEK